MLFHDEGPFARVLVVFFSRILSIRSFVALLSQPRLAQTVRVYIEFIFHTIVPVHRCFCTSVFVGNVVL